MSDKLRITGMASGLDVDTMVKTMMKPYNMKVDKAKQDRDALQWKQEAYRDILTDINGFKASYFDAVKPENYMLSTNSYSSYDANVTSVTPSASSGAVLTGTSSAVAGNYSITVNKIAKSAALPTSALPTGTKLDAKLNGLLTGSVDRELKLSFSYTNPSDPSNSANQDVTLKVTKDATVADLLSAINIQTKGNVVAKFSELTGKFSIQTNGVGSDSKISLTDIQLAGASETSILGMTANLIPIKGQDAEFDLTTPMGTKSGNTSKTNSFVIDGVAYNIANVSEGSTTNVNLSSNVQRTFDKIKGFVDKYNEIISKINGKIMKRQAATLSHLQMNKKKV